MHKYLSVVTIVGLEFAGKGTFVARLASRCGVPLLRRSTGYLGHVFQLASALDLASLGHPDQVALLRTFQAEVWGPAAWDISIAESDGIIVLWDPQPARAGAYDTFLERFTTSLDTLHFEPGDVPVVAVINKTDLVNQADLDVARARLEPFGWPIHFACAWTGEGVVEAFQTLIDPLVPRSKDRAITLDGDTALRLRAWTPFRARAAGPLA